MRPLEISELIGSEIIVWPFASLDLVCLVAQPEVGDQIIGGNQIPPSGAGDNPHLLGRQQAFALLGLGEAFSAEKAKATGLIFDVVDEDGLEEAVLSAARRIAAKPPEALKIARDLMRGNRSEVVERIKQESAHFSARLKSDEARAAFLAFMSRKKAS